jgi:hypothetical protein
MPFYPSLPNLPQYREQDNPVASLVGGINAGQNIYGKALEGAMKREALNEAATRRGAMEEFQRTGEPKALYPALNPEQAMMAPYKLPAAQMELANAAAKYWDNTKDALTFENYPAWREQTIRQFPQVNPAMFPSPDQFKTPCDFGV